MKSLVFKITASFFLALFLCFSKTGTAFANLDCKIPDNGWDPNTRSLQVCIAGFSSAEELRQSTVTFNCLGNSNLPNSSLCTNLYEGDFTVVQSFPLRDTPDSDIAPKDGGFYTCVTAYGIHRGIGKISVSATGPGGSCTTPSQMTKPGDWDPLTEGLPWQQQGNNPTRDESILCPDGVSIQTALGCIAYEPEGFIQKILSLSVGLGGAIALLLMLYGFFLLATSAGMPDKIKAGQEIITSAAAGLVFLTLSVILMNIIGVKILSIPGL